MTEDEVLPVEEEAPEVPPRPRRWWVPVLVLLLAGTLLTLYIPGLLPRERTGSGTGFAVLDGGYILTAAHVVRGATEIVVRWDGRGYRATAIATSADHDLALLFVETAPPIPPAPLADQGPEIGDRVTAVGYPSGSTRPIPLSTEAVGVGWWVMGPHGAVLRDVIATKNAFRPGYSGSPLVNEAGQGVGIVTGSVNAPGGGELGFAVSIHQAVDWLAQRGMTLPVASGGPAVREAKILSSVVRIEARFPPGPP